MINLVSLLVAAALVSLQCGFEAHAQIEGKNDLDNNLQPNAPPPKRRILRPFVNISDPPPKSVRVAPGTRTELVCEVIGKPAPHAQWLKNGQPLGDYDEVNEIFSIHPSSLARMTTKVVVSSAANGDEYTCVATAGLKQQMATSTVYTVDDDEANIFTLEALFRKPTKPVITEYYNEIFQDIGSSAVLPCRYYSGSKAQVYWLDSRDELIYGNSRIRVLPTGDLLVTNIRWEDMGNYTCTVKNKHGKDTVATFLYPAKKQ
ncbi:neural/ectodermal development factor IMP-L2-like isoform X2 [Ostrinia furnacalis]|uniref:neural/ectodermal development factor IMP-L2-like isoform X2 n=1 Tax=Ostrinia furnacalis TaxID=93504 RepID=UPI0010404B65|nr:neural/ectodermal development factor IMP-L2-like isoform X2 [Ostrinia furnacalis]